jgi:hypothetical protein
MASHESHHQAHRRVQDAMGEEVTSLIGRALLLLLAPFRAISMAKSLPVAQSSSLTSGGSAPIAFSIEYIYDTVAAAGGYWDRLILRFVKSPLGTASLLLSQIQSFWISAADKRNASSDLGINEALALLVLTALFLIFLDMKRQRERQRRRIAEGPGIRR